MNKKTSQLDSTQTISSNYLIQVIDTGDNTMSPDGTNKKITAKQFIDSAIGNALSSGTITGNKIAAGTITATNIATGTITAANIATGTITADKIATGVLTAITIGAGSITAVNIAAGTITGDKIAANTITAGNIAAGTITGDKIAANTITAGNIAANTITANQIAAGTITADKIATGVLTAISIGVGSITANQIAANTITASQIAANTITANQIAANTITANQIAAGTITATQIAAGTITANQIQAGAITANQIAANTITANQIAAGAITANQIQAGAITAGKIAAGAIASNSLLASNIIAASNLVTDFVLTKNIQSDNFNGQITTHPTTGVRTINVGTNGYYLDSVSGTVVVSKLVARDGIIAGNYIKYNNTGAFQVDSQGNLGVKVDDETLAVSNGSLVIKQVPSTSIVVSTQDINYLGGLNSTSYDPIGLAGGYETTFDEPYNIHLVWDALANVSSVMNVTSIDMYNLSITYDYSNVTNLAAASSLFVEMKAQWSDSPTALINSPVAFGTFAAAIQNPVLPLGPVTYIIPKFSISGRQVATNRYLLVWPEISMFNNNGGAAFGGTIGVSVPASTTASFIVKAVGQITSPNNAFSTLVKPAGLQIS